MCFVSVDEAVLGRRFTWDRQSSRIGFNKARIFNFTLHVPARDCSRREEIREKNKCVKQSVAASGQDGWIIHERRVVGNSSVKETIYQSVDQSINQPTIQSPSRLLIETVLQLYFKAYYHRFITITLARKGTQGSSRFRFPSEVHIDSKQNNENNNRLQHAKTLRRYPCCPIPSHCTRPSF